MRERFFLILLIVICLLFATCGLAGTNRVPSDYPTIQAAINASVAGDIVLVAPGTYTGDGNRDIDFKGKAITVKSEEGPQTCIIDCQGSEDDPHRGFYFHSSEDPNSVLQGLTIINGYVDVGGAIACDGASPTIRNCVLRNNTAYLHRSGGYGGGIYCAYSDAFVSDCVIRENTARIWYAIIPVGGLGGGIYCFKGKPTISKCIIESNHGLGPGEVGIAGIYCAESDATIISCIVRSSNHIGICVNKGEPTIVNCLIENNLYGITCHSGGCTTIQGCTIRGNIVTGIQCERGAAVVTCSLIVGNGRTQGGGVYCRFTNLLLQNCTIVSNCRQPAYSCAGVHCLDDSNCEVRNCIVWRNGPSDLPNELVVSRDGAFCIVAYSSVENGRGGTSEWSGGRLLWEVCNVGTNPCFRDPGYWDPNGTKDNPNDDFWINGDYHLKSQAGRWDPNSEGWVVDDVTSPCIDAGDPNNHVGHEPLPNGGRINMGAYGGTVEASKSYFGKPVCQMIIAGDINGDCIVDFKDFAIMAAHWLEWH
jgi:hypothetical protein